MCSVCIKEQELYKEVTTLLVIKYKLETSAGLSLYQTTVCSFQDGKGLHSQEESNVPAESKMIPLR